MTQNSINDLIEQLNQHDLYQTLDTEAAIHLFMESHIFCVWDFQSLIKAIQQQLTCVTIPWFPKKNTRATRFFNEIILGEESDTHPEKGYASHFELYRDAMIQAGANTTKIDSVLSAVQNGVSLDNALDRFAPNNAVKEFTKTTFNLIHRGRLADLIGVFTYSRELVIPHMFTQIIKTLARVEPERWTLFHFYLDRHVQLDADEHGPMAKQLLSDQLAENDVPLDWEQSVCAALQARLNLWDELKRQITQLNFQSA